jgi:uncharacterized protein YpbB
MSYGRKGMQAIRDANKRQWMRKKGLMPEMQRYSIEEALKKAGL